MQQASARSTFLLPINPALRLLHRAVLLQYEQAALMITPIAAALKELTKRCAAGLCMALALISMSFR